eukprot:sb/3473172/
MATRGPPITPDIDRKFNCPATPTTPTILIDHGSTLATHKPTKMSEYKRRKEDYHHPNHLVERVRSDSTSSARSNDHHDNISLCGSDVSLCSSTNRPASLCVKFSASEDNLLAIESDLEALDQESTFDKLQREFGNMTELMDYNTAGTAPLYTDCK